MNSTGNDATSSKTLPQPRHEPPPIDLRRSKRPPLGEWLAEKAIFAVATSAVLVILLIFLFVGREALPVALGQLTTSQTQEVLPPEQIDSIPAERLREYLGLTPAEFRGFDRETLQALMELRVEAASEVADHPDAGINTASWRHMILPHHWDGYDGPRFIWQPISNIPKYNIVPLVTGTLKTALVALLVSVPLSLAAALYVSQLAGSRLKEILKPGIEMLAGIPSVVLGAFAYLVLASALQNIFGYATRLNAFVAGVALAFAVIPVIFSIAEDALTSVPRAYTQAALALGASRWQAAWQIVLPAALPGVFAAVILGFGRAIGETMVVLLASGNASIVSWSLFDSTRTITATIAAEVLEAVVGGVHYRILFLIGGLLFLATFLSNLIGGLVIGRLKARLEGAAP